MSELNRHPLYRQVALLLREEIEGRMKPGEKLDSEEKLAKRFDVSVITTREALRILASEGWVVRRQGKGTFVAERALEKPVAVLIDRDVSHPRASYFFLRVAREVKAHLEGAGRTVRLYTGQLSPNEESAYLTCREFLEDLEADRFSGVIAVYAFPHPGWTRRLREKGIPLVGVGRCHDYSIDSDPVAFMKAAVAELRARGRSRIALMGWERGAGDPGENTDRTFRHAFLRALEDNGLALPPPEWVREDLHPALEAAGWEQFKELWSSRREKPDGLVITDDFLFRDAATAMLEMSISIPDTLMVVTHANRGSEVLYPFPVTRIEVDPAEAAATLCRMFIDLSRGITPSHTSHAYRYHVNGPPEEAYLATTTISSHKSKRNQS